MRREKGYKQFKVMQTLLINMLRCSFIYYFVHLFIYNLIVIECSVLMLIYMIIDIAF